MLYYCFYNIIHGISILIHEISILIHGILILIHGISTFIRGILILIHGISIFLFNRDLHMNLILDALQIDPL